MLGDAYFQLRAQVGTGLFSLLRLAAESGAREETLAALRATQTRARESFTFATLGPAGAGKSALLNALFEREFCGADVEPVTAGRIAIYQHADEPYDPVTSPEIVECGRPHIFLRDFTVIEGPAGASPEMLVALLERADVILYVLSAAGPLPDVWDLLRRLGRDLLKRLVFVVWQCDRVSSEEAASFVKRLRQAMLRHLGQACPIFNGARADAAAREKLVRWIESEVIFSVSRRQRLRDIDEVAREALREIVVKPRAERQGQDREIERVRRLRSEIEDWQEQSHRQVAGALWTLAQSFDGVRRGGEDLLGTHVRLADFFWKRLAPLEDFAREIEAQAHASFTAQLHDQLIALERDLREGAEEHFRDSGGARGKNDMPESPEFPRTGLEQTLSKMDTRLHVSRVVDEAFTTAVRMLQLPALAAAGALAIALGVTLTGRPSGVLAILAFAAVAFVVVLAVLLRRNVIGGFGRHFADNRTALLSTLEPPLRSAADRFYGSFVPALEQRVSELTAERERQQPLLAQLQQIEETFARLESDLRTGLARREATNGAPAAEGES